MNPEFSRVLTLLRQEKGVSQRVVAGELLISQALLSHYENGIREPGLDFLVRACDYYGVTADYMLGRTMSRYPTSQNGQCRTVTSIADEFADEDGEAYKGCLMLCETLCVLMHIIGKSEDKEITGACIDYLEMALYKVFRHLYNAVGQNPESFFSASTVTFLFGTDSVLKALEQRLVFLLSGSAYKGRKNLPNGLGPLSDEILAGEYPEKYNSLMRVVYNAAMNLKHFESGENSANS